MTLFMAGLVAGWPLLQAATAGGAEDALDALSRIFGYLNQRFGSICRVGCDWPGSWECWDWLLLTCSLRA